MSTVYAAGISQSFPCELVPICCHKCSGIYALHARFDSDRRQCGGNWHCPYCDVITAYCDTENARLRKDLAEREAALIRARERANESEKQLIAQKAATTRLRRRAAAGCCPACHRTFKQLASHMRNKHPDYAR